MANQWFRMYAEFASDPKVQMLSEAMQRRLVMLFCMRCSDVTVTLSDDEIAFQMRISSEELAETKSVFISKGFIDSAWNITNWEKRQFASDTSAARTRAYRDRKRDTPVTSHVSQSDALEQNRTDTEQSKEAKASLSADAANPCPHQEIIELYHANLPANPRIKVWDGARSEALRTRWREDTKRQSLDYWARFFRHCAGSKFLTGQVEDRNGRPFTPGLDWLVKAANFAKIIEGRYHDKVHQ